MGNDIGRRSPEPRHDDHHHHHHHHGHGHHKGHGGPDKVIIKGDDNNVSVHSRSRIARKYIPHHQLHNGESATDHVEHNGSSPDDSSQDRTEKHPRSVLINSVEGEEKYFVPDDYHGQRVTVIEGDGISKVLTKVKRGDPGIEGVPGSVEIMVLF